MGHRFIGKAHSNIPAFHGHPNIPRGTKDFSLSEPTSVCQLGFLFESAGADAYKDIHGKADDVRGLGQDVFNL